MKFMINRSKDYIMSDQSPVIDGNSPLVLKPAAAVNKNIFADRDILSAVCIEWRKYPERDVHWLSCEFHENLSYFFW